MFPPSAAEPVVHSGTLSDSVHFCWTVYPHRIFVGRHIAGLASAVEARVHCRLLPPAAVCWPVSQEIQTGPPLYATDMDCNECPKASGLENLCFRSSLMESLSCFNTCNLDLLQFLCCDSHCIGRPWLPLPLNGGMMMIQNVSIRCFLQGLALRLPATHLLRPTP